MAKSEFTEAYEEDLGRVRGAFLGEPISALEPRQPALVEPDTTVREAVAVMKSERRGCVCVVEGRVLVGIFTERDLLRAVQEDILTSETPVGGLMTPKPESLRPDHPIALALNMMSEGGYRHVPLTNAQGAPVGIVAMRDIVRFIVSMFPDVALNVPPDPRKIPTEYGG